MRSHRVDNCVEYRVSAEDITEVVLIDVLPGRIELEQATDGEEIVLAVPSCYSEIVWLPLKLRQALVVRPGVDRVFSEPDAQAPKLKLRIPATVSVHMF